MGRFICITRKDIEMKFDYKALAELIALAEVKKQSPTLAKLYAVFMKRGISMSETFEMLAEIVGLINELEEEEKNG